jgi:hypothetical protein
MLRKVKGGEPMKDQPTKVEATPPLLSEKLIAQLQSAVGAAQKRRSSNQEPTRNRNPFET